VDWLEYYREYTSYNSAKSTFETTKTSYNTLKDAYNTALAAETARKLDFFKSIFDPPIVVPERPCKPTQPPAWTGLDYKPTMTGTGNTFLEWTADNKAAKWATFSQNSMVQAIASTWRMGYQIVSADTSVGTPTLTTAGHIYGLLGQGAT
jgi:hypothetical protein